MFVLLFVFVKSMQKPSTQPLHWSIDRPLCYLGFTVDELAVMAVGIFPGVFMLSSSHMLIGLFLIFVGIGGCFSLKRFKKLCGSFRPRLFLITHGLLSRPKHFPQHLHQRISK